ncbi:LacI family transcriptional regulator [Actinocorallia sp. API 0066]|uniref:LacI family DNA-binding transcriptional regulator n=1 Tax=Actinocorallia sp. API 0066 TaxID=2896846 RepID=UPI001E62C60D|nr:LacI family DNA-binding transcriptional regulator [Actinocorallia sp. API 0066]MCD0448239.1 LacI family transcriptional regulator [Actinocorallia sp. API 0066]
MPNSRGRVTIRELARATGLSPAAVSYALRGLHTSAETQRRVRRAAAELGYRAHPIARALASGRTCTVGVLCGSLADHWQRDLAVRIGRELLEHNRYSIIVDAAGDPGREAELARRLSGQQVDGLIVQALDPAAPVWAELAEAVPIVPIGDALTGNTRGEVVFDNRRGVTLALEHLHGLGHRRVGVLTSTLADTPDRPADVHVRAEAARLGLTVEVAVSGAGEHEAAGAAARLLTRSPPPTAVFCFSDSIAYGVYAAARALGLRVPQDVSICGYDAHALSELLTPSLTTVDWRLPEVAADAVSLMVAALDDDAPEPVVPGARKGWRRAAGDGGGAGRRSGSGGGSRIVREPVLVPRGSTAPPGGAARTTDEVER